MCIMDMVVLYLYYIIICDIISSNCDEIQKVGDDDDGDEAKRFFLGIFVVSHHPSFFSFLSYDDIRLYLHCII